MRSRALPVFACCIGAIVLAAGCSKAPNAPTGVPTGTLSLLVNASGSGGASSASAQRAATGASSSYDAVNLVVREVAAHADGGSWEVIHSGVATYDLLALRNGVFASLGQGLLPAGHYTQLRLMLDAGSNVVVGGVSHPLIVPSGLKSGYKLTGSFDVPANGSLELALAFDPESSIVERGNGTYELHPTVRVVPVVPVQVTPPGAIAGIVLPDGATPRVVAIAGADTVATAAAAAADGSFHLGVLPAGTYTVAFHAPGWLDATIPDVVVSGGATTDVGTLTLKPDVPIVTPPGAIAGIVLPEGATPQVFAIAGADTVSTATAADDGSYQFSLLPAATYSVAFHAPGWIDTTFTDVVVSGGATTDVGTVTLKPDVPIFFRAGRAGGPTAARRP